MERAFPASWSRLFVALLALAAGADAAERSLRFRGNGADAPGLDRVTIKIDGPARPVDVKNDFTIELWMRALAGENGAAPCVAGSDGWTAGSILLDRDVSGEGDYGDWGLSLFGDGVAFGVGKGSAGGGICSSQDLSGRSLDLADGGWHHVALTRRRSDGRLRIFLDGELDAEGPGPAGNVSYRNGRSASSPDDPFLVIGAEKTDQGPEMSSFSGWIDEIRISSVIRYGSDFTPPVRSFRTDAATVALYHLDEGSGEVIGDSSGARGGPSDGRRRFGGSPPGPQWSRSNPFWPDLEVEAGVGGFAQPVHVTHAGDGSGRLFVVEKGGRIRILRGGAIVGTPFLDVSSLVSDGSEQGLLSIAFPPAFGAPGVDHFYVDYTDVAGDTVVARYEVSGNPDVADAGSAETILEVDQPFANHNGGQLLFGPDDGYLYVSMGDGGSRGDPQNNAQNTNVRLGKILRLDVESGDPPYVAPGNPFVGTHGDDLVWALGLRNPWRLSFDRLTGDLYIGDVGQQSFEEIDFQPAGSTEARNYGWRILEGRTCFNPPSGCVPPAGSVTPIAVYGHSKGCSVTGGFVYRGEDFPGMQGIYFHGDFCSGRIWGLKRDGPSRWVKKMLRDTSLRISSFGEDEDGELYVVDIGGSVARLIDGAP